jgi:diguanylate cyclase (GGDEF)-like protein
MASAGNPGNTAETAISAATSLKGSWLRALLPDRAFRGSEAVRLGRALLVVTGIVVAAALPLLHPSRHDILVVVGVSAAMTFVLVLSLFLPWSRWSDKPTVVFPVSVMLALACVGALCQQQVGACFTGLFVLSFAYIGICQRPHTALTVLPVALPTYVLSVQTLDTTTVIRLTVTAAVWTLLAELLAHLIRQQHLVAEMLESASRTDELTRLANRRDLETHLASVRSGDTLVMCDLDHFKSLNDSLGHAAGDVVLRDFGSVLLGCLRGDDYAARYGGEEFVLILAETDGGQTLDVLTRLRRRWAAVHPEITFSAGFATKVTSDDAHVLLDAADRAMYTAKSAGRDCFRSAQSQRVA